jgi:hypothetical protein
MSTENVAFMRLGQIETGAQRLERERWDLELRAAMVGVIADAHRSAPLDRPGFAPPAPTPGSNNGWRTAPPLAVPGGDATHTYGGLEVPLSSGRAEIPYDVLSR